jgi:Fic family protein
VTINGVRLFEQLPKQPIIILAKAMEILATTKPTASKAIDSLQQAGVLREITGKQRDRVYAYERYLDVLNRGMG